MPANAALRAAGSIATGHPLATEELRTGSRWWNRWVGAREVAARSVAFGTPSRIVPSIAFDEVPPQPMALRALLAGIFGSALGALAAATVLPVFPALMFGAAVGAYSGFLATAVEALCSASPHE